MLRHIIILLYKKSRVCGNNIYQKWLNRHSEPTKIILIYFLCFFNLFSSSSFEAIVRLLSVCFYLFFYFFPFCFISSIFSCLISLPRMNHCVVDRLLFLEMILFFILLCIVGVVIIIDCYFFFGYIQSSFILLYT